MYRIVVVICLVMSGQVNAQTNGSGEEKWGLVLEHPETKHVIVIPDLVYAQAATEHLKMDIYLPSNYSQHDKLAAVIFLPELLKDKSWEIYKTWPRLAAAYGLIGISLDVDRNQYVESLKKAANFLTQHANEYKLDAENLGIFAASHIPDPVINALIKENVVPAIKVAALYYREPTLQAPFRKELPVLFITDDQTYFSDNRYTVLWQEIQKSKAPWTIKFGTGMPHFFDAFSDTDAARKIIRETIYFWKNHLEPVSAPSWEFAEDRAMIAALYSGDRTKAVNLFRLWLEKNPADQYALLRYGMMSFLEGQYREAEKAYKKVSNLEPVYMIDLVKILLAQDKGEEADAYLTKALATGQVKRSPYAGIGSFLYSLRKYKEGIPFYEKAMEKDPMAENFYNLARGYAKIGDKGKALQCIKKALDNGYKPEQIHAETDFNWLRNDKEYKRLLKKYQK